MGELDLLEQTYIENLLKINDEKTFVHHLPDTYFPKGFEGYVNWNARGFPYGWSPKDSGVVVAYHDCDYGDSTWEPVYMKARTIIDIECELRLPYTEFRCQGNQSIIGI